MNVVLILGILLVLFLQFYKKEIALNCNYDAKPVKLLEIIKDSLPGITIQDVTVCFIFNQLPSISNIETVNKLHAKYKDGVTIMALFNRKFRFDKSMNFPYKFLSRKKITCSNNKELTDKNYFVILKNNKIRYSDKNLDLVNLAFLVQKNKNSRLSYSDMAASSGELKKRITTRLKKGQLRVLKLNSNEEEVLNDLSGISKVYFIHASCSTCRLKSLFSELKLKQIVDNQKKYIVIFSVFADSFKLSKVAEDSSLKRVIFLDINDEFNLFSTITDEKNNPLIIDLKESIESVRSRLSP